jgi:hypothetical protein
MPKLMIQETDNSPKVILCTDTKLIEFEGKSYPENTFEFYQPILKWLETCFLDNDEKMAVNFKFTYFNSATTQIIYDILDLMQEHKSKISCIHWYYDENNENSIEDYEDYSDEFPDLSIEAVSLQGEYS